MKWRVLSVCSSIIKRGYLNIHLDGEKKEASKIERHDSRLAITPLPYSIQQNESQEKSLPLKSLFFFFGLCCGLFGQLPYRT
jgi:hypothetical protein